MKKNLLLFLLSMLTAVGASAYDFSAKNADGKTIYYNRIDNDRVSVTYKSTSSAAYSGDVVIPAEVLDNGNQCTVVEIGESAFINCSSLNSLTIPNSVTQICDKAFYRCTDLSQLTVESLTPPTLGTDVFFKVNLPNVVLRVSKGASNDFDFSPWRNFNKIEELDYSFSTPNDDGVMIYYLFNDDQTEVWVTYKQTSDYQTYSGDVVIPQRAPYKTKTYPVTSINKCAFMYSYHLNSVELPNSIRRIDIYAFYQCYALSSISLPESLVVIDTYAFANCENLRTINIPASVLDIRNFVFTGCVQLQEITVDSTEPKRIAMGQDVFADVQPACTLLVPRGCYSKYADLPKWNVLNIMEVGMNCTFCTTVNGGPLLCYNMNPDRDSVTLTYKYSSNNDYSGDIVIPKAVNYLGKAYTVSAIGQRAFEWSDVVSVFIPSTVSEIGEFAFFGCLSLKDVYVDVPKASDIYMPNTNGMFEYADLDNATLYVPKGGKSSYSNAIPWKYFGNIVEKDLSGVDGVVADPEADGVYFDLYGRRVDNPSRGLFIRNGKKVILK